MQKYTVEYHIYRYRIEKGWSLRKLEDLSGVAKSEINDIENGKKHPSVPTLYSLSVALDKPFQDLFTIK